MTTPTKTAFSTRLKDKLLASLGAIGSSFWALLLGVSIGVSPYVYLSIVGSPKLQGRVVSIMTSESQKTMTAFLFISNSRDVPVPILDYEMVVHYKSRDPEVLHPSYEIADTLFLGFGDTLAMVLPMDKQYLLRKVNTLITKEAPLTGFVVFKYKGVANFPDVSYLEARLVDGFGKTHSITANQQDLVNPGVLKFLISGYSTRRIPTKDAHVDVP